MVDHYSEIDEAIRSRSCSLARGWRQVATDQYLNAGTRITLSRAILAGGETSSRWWVVRHPYKIITVVELGDVIHKFFNGSAIIAIHGKEAWLQAQAQARSGFSNL